MKRKSTEVAPVPLSPITLGIDLGDRLSHVCVLDASGEVVERLRIATTHAAFASLLEARPRSRVVIEASTHSPWVSRAIEAYGHEGIVANPRHVQLISSSKNKSDRVDAESLARLGRVDPKLLHGIRHRSATAQAHLSILRARDALLRCRTSLIAHVRCVVKSEGSRLSSCDTDNFVRRVRGQIPAAVRPALLPLLRQIEAITREVKALDRRVEALCKKTYPVTTLLRQVDGVGPITSLAYVLTLDSPERFKKSRSVGAFLGLNARRAQSGESDPQLRITKAGNPFLRRMLVNAAHYVLGPFGPDCALRRFGDALAARGGRNAKKRAVVAVARKLAVLLHHLWRSGEIYEPLRNARPSPPAVASA